MKPLFVSCCLFYYQPPQGVDDSCLNWTLNAAFLKGLFVSTSPLNTAAATTSPVTASVLAAAKPAAPAAPAKKPAARKAAVVPSQHVVAKAAPLIKTAAKTPALKASAVKAPLVKVAVKTAVNKPAAAKPVVKPAAKTVAKTVAKPVKATVPAAKPKAAKKPKLVRDSFTIPKAEYLVLDDLKQRAARLAQPVKKSELLRAGIKALAAMSDTALRAALKDVPAIKTGRPASDK